MKRFFTTEGTKNHKGIIKTPSCTLVIACPAVLFCGIVVISFFPARPGQDDVNA